MNAITVEATLLAEPKNLMRMCFVTDPRDCDTSVDGAWQMKHGFEAVIEPAEGNSRWDCTCDPNVDADYHDADCWESGDEPGDAIWERFITDPDILITITCLLYTSPSPRDS